MSTYRIMLGKYKNRTLKLAALVPPFFDRGGGIEWPGTGEHFDELAPNLGPFRVSFFNSGGGDIIRRLCVVGEKASALEESIISFGDMSASCEGFFINDLLDEFKYELVCNGL